MMIAAISRLTTDYVDAEDRLRLSGEVADSTPVAMWLTQRLALRVLPALLQWLDGQTGGGPQDAAGSRSSAEELRKQVVHSFRPGSSASRTEASGAGAGGCIGRLVDPLDRPGA